MVKLNKKNTADVKKNEEQQKLEAQKRLEEKKRLKLPDGQTVEQFIRNNIEILPKVRFKGLTTKLNKIKIRRYDHVDVENYIIDLIKIYQYNFKEEKKPRKFLFQKIDELTLPPHFFGEGYSYKETKKCLDDLTKKVRTAIIDDEEGQFIALGLAGSGKTSFLTAIFTELSEAEGGFTIHVDDDTRDALLCSHEKLINDSNNEKNDTVIPATDQRTDYSLILKYSNSEIEKLQWIDYPGGWLKSRDKDQQDKMKNSISNAKAIYIVVDGEKFFPENKSDDELIKAMKDNLTIYLSHFMGQYSGNGTSNPPIIFIVTKSDVIIKNYPEEDSTEKATKIIKKAFNQYFTEITNNFGLHNMVGIVPVSLGVEYYKNNNHGVYSPVNVQIPLFIGLYFLIEYNLRRIRQSDKPVDTSKKNAQERLRIEIEKHYLASKNTENPKKNYKFFYDGEEMKFSAAAEKYLGTEPRKNQQK